MKKFASLLLTAVLLAAMLTVFAVPASAEDAPVEISASQLNRILYNSIIKEPGEHEVEVMAVAPSAKLIIGEGVTIKVTKGVGNQGTIEVLGTLDVSQCGVVGRERIIIGDTGVLIDPRAQEDLEAERVDGKPKTVTQDPRKGGSILSEGSLTIIIAIAALVIGLGGGFFIGKAAEKKKKPALASGTDNTDEE